MTTETDRKRKVLALYRQAAGTDNPHERDAFLAKAKDLDIEPVGPLPLDDAAQAGYETFGRWRDTWLAEAEAKEEARLTRARAATAKWQAERAKRAVTVTGLGRFDSKSVTVQPEDVRLFCPRCLEPLITPDRLRRTRRGPFARYCSSACRQAAYRARARISAS
jgi:RNase P subunit RPR2